MQNSQKFTIIGLRQLRKGFYKHIREGANSEYNNFLVNKLKLSQANSCFKVVLKDHIKINDLDLEKDGNRIYHFINSNFLEKETYNIKIPIALMKWHFSNCRITVLEDENDIICMVVYSIQNIQINDKTNNHVNLKLICTNKTQRHKKYATKLLAIIEKRNIENDNLSAVFMSNIGFMKEFSKLKYYYRPINSEILLMAGFSGFKEADFKNNEKNIVDYFKISDVPSIELKKLELSDQGIVEELYELYNEDKMKYNYFINYTKEEFSKLLLNDAISTYCVIHDKKVCDFISYYKVYHESVVNKKRRDISVANLFMYTTQNTNVYKLIKNLLIVLANENVDMITILDNMENDTIIEPLRFMDSQSYNYIYLFNWLVCNFNSTQIGSIAYF